MSVEWQTESTCARTRARMRKKNKHTMACQSKSYPQPEDPSGCAQLGQNACAPRGCADPFIWFFAPVCPGASLVPSPPSNAHAWYFISCVETWPNEQPTSADMGVSFFWEPFSEHHLGGDSCPPTTCFRIPIMHSHIDLRLPFCVATFSWLPAFPLHGKFSSETVLS